MGTRNTGRRPAESDARYVQFLGYYLAQAKLNGDQLAERSGVPRYKISQFLNGVAPIDEETARDLAAVLKCPAEELVSGPAGVRVSGAAIFETHDLRGQRLPGARPLTAREWRRAWVELDAEGVLPDQVEQPGVTPDERTAIRATVAACIAKGSLEACSRAA
jgi:transcriptional regulator with XRE-family HTH domain